MRDHIGWFTSPNTVDLLALQSLYSSLNLTDLYLYNALAFPRFVVANNWAQLGLNRDINKGSFSDATVQAYYRPVYNGISVLAGIEQFPFFQTGFLAYLNYGGLGSILGHVLTHDLHVHSGL